MLILHRSAWLLAVLILGGISATADSYAEDAADKIHVGFRLANWKTFHIHDAAEAEKQVKTLTALGCEVKTAQHDGHTDLQTRTGDWKLLALDSGEQAKQWSGWLAKTGFEVLHGELASKVAKPTDGKPHEVVLYKLPATKSLHVHQAQDAAQEQVLLRALGCKVSTSKHNGHTDLSLNCPEWMQVELPTHKAAHAWQNYLNSLGFETRHEH